MPYSFSIAPTNKAKCKGKCKEFIDKGAIRFATEGEGWGDFSVSSYRCLDCVTKKQFENVLANHGPIETVPGFDALDDDDQESVMEAAAEVGVAPAKKAPAKKAPTKKKKAAPQKKKDHPDVKADKLRKRLRELVLMRRFQYIDIEIDGGAQVFPLKQQQRDELAKWAAHKKFDTDWLQVEDGPLGFVANSGSTNALVLGDGAWEDDEAQEGAKWAELVSARDFGCVQVQVGNQKFQPRQNQQDELVKWAAGGKFDTGWLVVEDFPSHFVDQNGKMNRLCLTDDAFLARHKGKKTKAAPLASPPAKKAKVTASPQSAGKKIQIPADFWAAQGSKPKPFSPLELKKVEDKLGYQLPRSYLQLMMKQNGGVPTRTRVRTPAGGAATIETFFAIDNLLDEAENWLEEWEYPDIGIYICDCPSAGHDMVCLDYSKCGPKGEPRVSHVDQEGDFAVTELAPTFADFVEALEEAGDDDY